MLHIFRVEQASRSCKQRLTGPTAYWKIVGSSPVKTTLFSAELVKILLG